jgi:hypothetical protein
VENQIEERYPKVGKLSKLEIITGAITRYSSQPEISAKSDPRNGAYGKSTLWKNHHI